MGHSSIHVTFDTYGHLFPGRGKDASERFEKSMEIARKKAESDVSNPLAEDSGGMGKPEVSNWTEPQKRAFIYVTQPIA